jgi:hypothetical protein
MSQSRFDILNPPKLELKTPNAFLCPILGPRLGSIFGTGLRILATVLRHEPLTTLLLQLNGNTMSLLLNPNHVNNQSGRLSIMME